MASSPELLSSMSEPVHPRSLCKLSTLRAFVDAAPIGFGLLDTHLRYLHVNDCLACMNGATVANHVGKHVRDIIPEFAKTIEPKLQSVLDTGKSVTNWEASGRLHANDPNTIYRLLNYYPVRDLDQPQPSKILGIGITVLDITELKEAELRANENFHLFTSVMDQSKDAIFVKDRNLRYLTMNRAGLEWLGRTLEETRGFSDYDLFDTKTATEMFELDLKITLDGIPRTIENRVLVNGKERVFQSTKCPYKDPNDQIVGLIGITRDITESKRHAIEREELLHKERQSKDALKLERDLRERFVSALTHDMRSPLTAAIAGSSLLLRAVEKPDKVQAISARILDNLNRIDQMIRDLLDASQVRAGKHLPLKCEPLDLLETVRAVIKNLETIHGDRFKLEYDQGPWRGIWSRLGISRILENLCNNAIRYGDKYLPVILTLRRVEGPTPGVRLEVNNRGPVIPPQELSQLFTPFKRGALANAKDVQGWGLGLTVALGLAESHGGTIKVESSEKGGTTFFVSLPWKTEN